MKLRVRNIQQKFLDEVKLSYGCIDCGYVAHPKALDFDHVRGEKSFTLSRLAAQAVDWVRIIRELRKCEVRCANCHRIKTYTD